MNARILRKWSIHTKNLMSCSVCSLVVVVLLLLVTCAPSLILATMNFRSDASFAANPLHMPTNIIKATSSSSSTSTTTTTATAKATAKASTSILLSTILSPSSLPSSSLPNRHHRLASASTVVEVVKTPDTDREPFPGYYKNSYADDTHQMPQIPNGYPSTSIRNRHSDGDSNIGIGIDSRGLMSFTSSSSTSSGSSNSSSSSSSSSSRSSSSSMSKHRFNDNTQQQQQHQRQLQPLHSSGNSNSNSNNDNLGYTLQLRGWPRHRMPSYNDESIKQQHTTTTNVVNENENIKDASDNDEDAAADQNILYIRNGENNPPAQQLPMHSIPYYHNHRRMTEERSFQLPSITAKPSTSHIAAATVPTTLVALAHKHKQPELIHHSKNINNVNNDTKYIFSTTKTTTLLQQQQYNNTVSREKNHQHHLQHFNNNNNNNNNANVNKIKSSDLPLRFVIESYEVPASLPLARELTQQQRRMLIHEQHLRQLRTMQQQAARSRRDSLRGRYKNELRTTATSSSSSQSASSSSPSASLLSYRKFPATHYNSNSNLRQQYQQQHQHQHQHQHHHQHQQRIRMRKHSRRYCSARDPAQLAFEAPTVFEGKIVSMTPDRRQNFSATVEVREVFKQQIGYRLQKYLRLQFAYRNNSGECDIYREQLRSRGLVRGDTIEPGRMYLLFVQQIDIGNFTILGQPIRKTKRVVEAVRYAVSGNYAQLASIKSISASNRTVENGQELRIVCRVTGRPPPKVTWFKDHRSINRNRKLYQFSHYKKRSELIIRSFNTSDAGRYECRAKNKVNRNIERRAIVIKAYPVQRFDPNPRGTGNSCPDDASEFCFNGGTCKFFSEIGSYSCICPEGFIGERCDRKEVNNMPPSTYSNEHECGENKYLGSYYC